jgi:hypothetical protein
MVRAVPSCRGLFAPRAASGGESLASTHYVALAGRERARVCVGGVVTLTAVGGRVTWLCPEFGSLDPREAAFALVHEALHAAGLTESPATSGALTAREVNGLVERACAGDGVSEGVLLALGPRP